MLAGSDFWRGKRVLLTGHTGFKGSWMSLVLERLGSHVAGFALAPDQKPNLFRQIAPFSDHRSIIGDVADTGLLEETIGAFLPQIVIHMAAQPLVRRSYEAPVETFLTNVQGTANLLNALRDVPPLEAVLVITTDKVYRNPEDGVPFREDDVLGGHDPYSASKAAVEIVVESYANSFFRDLHIPVATARAGNVIGGGDWSADRLVPDVIRAAMAGRQVELRHPDAVRPWQHVLDPLRGYLMYIEALVSAPNDTPRALNFGPETADDHVTVADLVDLVTETMSLPKGWCAQPGRHPEEMTALALDSGLANRTLNWRPRLRVRDAIELTARWYEQFMNKGDMRTFTAAQIDWYGNQGD
ncbi:MAG: CDP-glucose 4,6-dehydratase, partial [Pseudomonadota bacterium]